MCSKDMKYYIFCALAFQTIEAVQYLH